MSYGTACITRSSNPRNQLLQHLAYGDMERLRPMLRRVTLVAGQILYERGDPLRNVFFIEEGIVTLLAKAKNADVVEVGLTGREGVIGAPVLLRSEAVALHRTIVQGPGSAWMIGSGAFLAAADDLPRLRNWCLRYLYSTHAEAVQTAACHALHAMTARFARRLLMTYDRMEGDTVLLTQEHLAQMLGVRRASVTSLGPPAHCRQGEPSGIRAGGLQSWTHPSSRP